MKRTIRVRERKVDVELSVWKVLPIFFIILIFILAATAGSANPGQGAAPSGFF
ncbi:MAG: hypothetical protein ACFFFH_11350 [Candidatus Thorarchaeota archaeon]